MSIDLDNELQGLRFTSIYIYLNKTNYKTMPDVFMKWWLLQRCCGGLHSKSPTLIDFVSAQWYI